MTTNVVRILAARGVPVRTHEYAVDEAALDARSVARSVGAEEDRVWKTLVAMSDTGEPLVFCIPGPLELDLKKAALAAGCKRIALIPRRELQPLTGYVHGGCSPIGMKRAFRTWIDEAAVLFDTILVSGGVRGLQVEIAPAALAKAAGAVFADVSSHPHGP